MYPTQLDLDPDQILFGQTCRQFLEKEFPVATVRELLDGTATLGRDLIRREAELGWFGLLSPEAVGGGGVVGNGVADSVTVAGELGRFLHPGAALMTNVIAQVLAVAGSPEQRRDIVPGLIDGSVSATWAIGSVEWLWNAGRPGITMTPDEHGGLILNGTAECVQDAGSADYLLVTGAVSDGSFAQVIVPRDTARVTVTLLHSLDLTREFGTVRFDNAAFPATARVGEPTPSATAFAHQVDLVTLLQTAETVGAIDRVYEFTLQYARDRVAFGRPIGSYQAIKHRLADLLVQLESAKATVAAATRALSEDSEDSSHLASVAAAYVGEVAPRFVQECVQLHGGIGLTWEHDIHLYLRRVAANTALLGSPPAHRRRIASILMLADHQDLSTTD